MIKDLDSAKTSVGLAAVTAVEKVSMASSTMWTACLNQSRKIRESAKSISGKMDEIVAAEYFMRIVCILAALICAWDHRIIAAVVFIAFYVMFAFIFKVGCFSTLTKENEVAQTECPCDEQSQPEEADLEF